jgi:hypothetical protein
MDAVRELLQRVQRQEPPIGPFRGLLHVLIGRRIVTTALVAVSAGLTCRLLAEWLKELRWDRDAVRELGLDPATLSPRDRVRFWYQAMAQAQLNSPAAALDGARFAANLADLGYAVLSTPGKE